MTVARARRYPQPAPVADVLGAARCDHGEIVGKCPLCRRLAAKQTDDAASAADPGAHSDDTSQ
jgi:hypothetical protein